MAQALLVTDFLPSRFSGKDLNADLAQAHLLAFIDYLRLHELEEPQDEDALLHIVNTFKCTLQRQARIWIEGKIFESLEDLQTQFVSRFSPSSSRCALTKQFQAVTYIAGETAEVLLSKISKLGRKLHCTDTQIRDRFLGALPSDCRSAVLMAAPEDALLPTLVTKAQCFLDLNNSGEGRNEISSSQDTTFAAQNEHSCVFPPHSDIKELITKIDNLQTAYEREDKSRNTVRSSSRRPPSSRSRYRSQDNCRFSPRNRPTFSPRVQYYSTIVCNFCGMQGHIYRNCPVRLQNISLPPLFPYPGAPSLN